MARKGGWRRVGSRRHFRYVDSRGKRIDDPDKIPRIEALVIPPAWRDVWISPRPGAKLQATGLDAAGRRQYLYHPEYRAAQEQAKYDKLIRFAERLPELRAAMAEHMSHDSLDRERISAVAVRLINLGWFRVGSERYAKTSKTFGITTLTKRHVSVRGSRISFRFVSKHRVRVRTALVDAELADAIKELRVVPGGRRLFRYEWEGELYNLTGRRLNDYIRDYLGEEFTVSPAVIEQYLDGRTIDDFRPRHLRVVALEILTWIERSKPCSACSDRGAFDVVARQRDFSFLFGYDRSSHCPSRRRHWLEKQCWSVTIVVAKSEREKARRCA